MDTSELVRKYEPVLRFSCNGRGEEENFFPMAVELYVGDSRLCRRGEGVLPQRPTLETLAAMSPMASRDFYLAYAAGDVLRHDPSFKERLRHGGLALFSVDGDVKPHLVVQSNEAFAFATKDPGLEPEALTSADPSSFSPGSPGSEAVGATFRIADAPRLPETIRDKALERYAAHRNLEAQPPVYYYHVTPNRGYLVIQYWFFYAYNDWGTSHGGVNDHEGDWEAIFVFLQNGQPAFVALSAHNGPPQRLAWDSPALEKAGGTHVVARVGCGSHACYSTADVHTFFGSIRDYHRGESTVAVGPGTGAAWGEAVDLAGAPWALNFAGSWGALVKRWGTSWLSPGAQAPTGPVWHYAQWESPVQWARIVH